VYLVDSASADKVSDIERALRGTPAVRSVRVVSSEAARNEVLGEHADPMLAALPEKSFPASLEVSVADDTDATEVEKIARTLTSLPAVESVETYASWSERLGSLLGAGVLASALLSIVVLAAVASVVASTLRLTLQRRLMEVQVTKLVGATDEYVRRPFVIEGAFQGALGSLVSIVIVALLFLIVRSRFDAQLVALLGLTPRFLPWYAALLLVVTGGALGAASAHLSLKKLLVL